MPAIPPSPILSSRSPHRRRMRCPLAVPAVRQEFFQKAADSDTDALFLDLEDSVFPEQKLAARANAARALNEVAWKDKRVLVRTNALDTEWAFHPSQIGLANQAHTPSSEEVIWAHAVIAALDATQRKGKGAVALNGQLLDIAHRKIANRILARAGGVPEVSDHVANQA